MGPNQLFWPKGQGNWPKEDLSENKPSSRIPIRTTWGRFESRACVEEEDRLKHVNRQMKAIRLHLGYYLAEE